MNEPRRSDQRRNTASLRAVSQSLHRLVTPAAAAGVAITAASFFGRSHWLLELLTHFRMHLAIGMTLVVLLALANRRTGVAIVAAVAAVANLAPMSAYILPGPPQAEAGQAGIRIMSANLGLRNTDYAALRTAISEENPDLVALQEVNDKWMDELSAIRADYPYIVERPEDGAYGLALFSRLPMRELESSPYVEEGVQTALLVEMEGGPKAVTMVLVHLKAPTSPRNAELRNRQLDRLAAMVTNDRNDEQILVGDFNATPWSPYYTTLETKAELTNAARGRGYRATWPVGLGFFKIPIDHCLVSSGLWARQMRTGRSIGSDHFPIVVDIEFADASTQASR
jgi:endonuclease/exonuclease/phosphatase (EEP) superfamily protein YafD